MDNIFITSTVSLRTRGPVSFSFSDYIYYSNERFGRYPCAYSSHLSSRTCCTCLSNTVCKVPISPSCNCNLYGSRQSNLIQWLPHKKLIFGGFDRCYDILVPVCDVDRSCNGNKVRHIGDRSVGGRRGELRKCMVSEEGSKRCSFVGDESEVLLSLLTEELGEECSDAREENRRLIIKKTVVDKKGNGETSNRCKSKTKRVDSGVPKTESKFEYESVVFRSREEDKRRREERIRSEKDKEDLRRKENLKALKKEEREALLRKESANARENEERETLLRKENWKVRVREEERDDLLRREERRERMRRDGSSCSSYYSLSSTGESNRDTEIEGTGDGFGVELSNKYEKDSKMSDKIVSDEVGKEDCGVGMRKECTEIGLYAGSSGAASDFGKKSEKKLNNVLIEETESGKGALQKDSSLLKVHESSYGKTGSYRSYDDRKVKSTSSIKFDEERRQQQKQTGNEVMGHSETKMKYKQFAEMPESPDDEILISYGSQKLYSGREEKSAKVSSLSSDAKREHRIMVGLGTREDEYSRNTHMVSEASKVQEIDARKTTSISERLSETKMKKEEDNSNDAITSNYDAEKKQQPDQVTRLKDERGNSQQLIKKQSSSISQIQSDSRTIKQEESVNLTYGSYTESKEKHIQTHAESFGTTDVRIGTQQMTNESVSHSGGLIGAEDGNKTRSETLVTPPSSQLAARDESYIETMSGLAIEEGHGIFESGSTAVHKRVLGPALHQEKYGGDKSDEAHEQPFMFISNEDAIGSAEQLQKSSAHYVGEFVEKARHEISTSEILEEKKTYEFEREEQSNRKGSRQYVSRESESKEHHSRHSSRGYKTKGLSDETWEVDAPSVQEHSKTEVQDDASKAENAIVKRSGRSLWNIIGDIVRLKWSTRSESRSTGGKAGGVSPNRSTSSDAWFSGHEVEEDDVNGRKESNMTQEAASIHQKQEKTSTPIKEDGSSTLTVEANAKHVGVDTLSSSTVIESGSASMSISLPSSEETSKSNFEGSSSGAPVTESLIQLPATRLQRSPIVKEISAASEAGSSGSDTSEQPVSTDLVEKSRREVNKLKQRKLQRKDQIPKDRFDEWEEAYRVEAEQRKMDEMFMGEALLEAKKAADNWEVPVGAVLVQGGKIIARGCNLVEELRDSTAHAEMICIREASNVLRTWRLSETTLYVTLEPCPMCAGAILQARIDTVVWGAPNKLLGADGSWIRLFPSGDGGNELEQTDKPAAPVHPFHPKITIRRGVLASECADAMQRFFQLRRREKEKISEPSTPPSRLPISHHRPMKFFTKMHDAFNITFCL